MVSKRRISLLLDNIICHLDKVNAMRDGPAKDAHLKKYLALKARAEKEIDEEHPWEQEG